MLLAMTLLLREDLSTTFGRGDGSGSHRQDEARQTRRAAMSLQKRGREWYQIAAAVGQGKKPDTAT